MEPVMHRILPLLILVAACGKDDSRATPPPAPKQPALEHATQSDLVRELADAERLGTWREVQQRWQGQTLRWTVTRQRALCSSADDCNVAAFPVQRPAKQGWMPGLTFAPGQYDELTRTCGSQDQCEVTIEGTLSKLEVSPEMPTSLQLSNVHLVAAKTPTRTAHT
jgi:hypothetical protein